MAYGQSEGEAPDCRGPEDVIKECLRQQQDEFNYNRAGIWQNASNYIENMFIFTDVCMQYTQLQVIEEIDNCIRVYQEYNGYMDQLWQNRNER